MARLLLFVVLVVLTVCSVSGHYHPDPDITKLTTGVKVDSGNRNKRQARGSLRIVTIFDSSVDAALPPEKASMLRDQTVPSIKEYFESALQVDRVSGPLLFDRDCEGGSFFPSTNIGPRGCATTCSPTTTCGEVNIPNEHLKGCIQCEGGTSNECIMDSVDGAGVNGADVVLYISAVDTDCPPADAGGAQTVAFATSCQLEASLDRPIVGNINFCPLGVTGNVADYILELGIHEAMHALAFSTNLFAYWRDENGNPRTTRDTTGRPINESTPSDTTIQSTTIPNWGTFTEVVSHPVSLMVTPAVTHEARQHFNCPTLPGVELENQGGTGTQNSHWEKRVLGNEGMTGELTFNPVFSRITLAAFEDSGWYTVNYDKAGELAWGRNAGCDFFAGSCYDWIQLQRSSGNVSPFCDDPPGTRGCTVDHQALGRCDISSFTGDLPTDFQYFSDPRVGGSVQIADFCPFYNSFNILDNGVTRGTECNDPFNEPSINALAESYGPGSRCIQHGSRDWTNSAFTGFTVGSGCYQYSCQTDAQAPVSVTVAGRTYPCTCQGEEIRFSFSEGSARLTGSFICPSCAQLCYDNLASCPVSEAPACPGRITEVDTDPATPMPGDGAMPTVPLTLVLVVIATIVTALAL